MKYFAIILFAALYGACNSENTNDLIIQPEKTADFQIDTDTIRVPTPGTTREFPYTFPSFDFSTEFFAGLDMRTGKVNIVDLESMRLVDSIEIHQKGPHAIQINMIGSIYFQSSDSIIILQHIPNRLLIIDSNGEIIWQKDLKEILQQKDSLKGCLAYAFMNRFGVYYNDDKAFFALRQNRAEQDFLVPLIGYYDFEKQDIQTLNIHYPAFYTDNEDLGIYDFPGITWLDEVILVTFPHSPEIFVYDYKGQLLQHILGPPEFKKGKPPAPGESEREHSLYAPSYRNILPVQNGRYFIQHSREKIMLDPQGEIFAATVVYNSDFTEYHIIDKNDSPLSFNGDYFYYPIPPEHSEYQLLERYRIE